MARIPYAIIFTMSKKTDRVLRKFKKSGRKVIRQVSGLFKKRSKPAPFWLSVLFNTLKLLLFAFVVIGFILLGLAVGVAKAYVETTPSIEIAQLTKSSRTSYLYDRNGNLITSIADVEYRDWVDIEDIPDMLKNAFVSVEDVRFYKHSGVDFKRLFSAALEILGSSNSSGGSTITQQLIKNKVLGSQRNYKRKIQEAYLALELEQDITKDEILEAYLNDIHLGESNYGVKAAAKDYFNKDLAELTIRECAMLAGLTQQPYRYNPRKNMYQRNQMDVTNARTDQVLGKMYQAGYITSDQYNNAMNENVYIVEVSQQKKMYDMAYFVEYSIRDVVTHLLVQRGLTDTANNRSLIENELRTGGYRIYTTVDPQIQNIVQNSLSTWTKYPILADSTKSVIVETNSDGTIVSETVEPQAAAVVLDHRTGDLIAVVGGRDEPTVRKSLNRAWQSYTEVGSSIKPLSIYGPALDLGLSPATIIPNMDGPINGWTTEQGYPNGGLDSRYGPVTLRRGLMSSLNVVAARLLMEYVTPDVSANYLYQLGCTESKINVDGPGLALGTSGITPIQMAGAYGAIANAGVYKEPMSFTKVMDAEGNVILDADVIRETRRVYQETTAYLLIDMMQDAVKSGTGTKARIEDMTVAGKTGTNSDYGSVYFAGMTPYYTATVFIGHDYPVNKLKEGSSGGNEAAPLWQDFMSKIHAGMEDKPILNLDPSSYGMVRRTVCSVSGLLATDDCKNDSDHKPVTDWFLPQNAPNQYCDMHFSLEICTASHAIATQFCPSNEVVSESYLLITPQSQFYQFEDRYLFKALPNAIRTDLSRELYIETMQTCPVHASGSLSIFELRTLSEQLSADVEDYLVTARSLGDEDRNILKDDLSNHTAVLNIGYDYSAIEPAYNKLKVDYERIRTLFPY